MTSEIKSNAQQAAAPKDNTPNLSPQLSPEECAFLNGRLKTLSDVDDVKNQLRILEGLIKEYQNYPADQVKDLIAVKDKVVARIGEQFLNSSRGRERDFELPGCAELATEVYRHCVTHQAGHLPMSTALLDALLIQGLLDKFVLDDWICSQLKNPYLADRRWPSESRFLESFSHIQEILTLYKTYLSTPKVQKPYPMGFKVANGFIRMLITILSDDLDLSSSTLGASNAYLLQKLNLEAKKFSDLQTSPLANATMLTDEFYKIFSFFVKEFKKVASATEPDPKLELHKPTFEGRNYTLQLFGGHINNLLSHLQGIFQIVPDAPKPEKKEDKGVAAGLGGGSFGTASSPINGAAAVPTVVAGSPAAGPLDRKDSSAQAANP